MVPVVAVVVAVVDCADGHGQALVFYWEGTGDHFGAAGAVGLVEEGGEVFVLAGGHGGGKLIGRNAYYLCLIYVGYV